MLARLLPFALLLACAAAGCLPGDDPSPAASPTATTAASTPAGAAATSTSTPTRTPTAPPTASPTATPPAAENPTPKPIPPTPTERAALPSNPPTATPTIARLPTATPTLPPPTATPSPTRPPIPPGGSSGGAPVTRCTGSLRLPAATGFRVDVECASFGWNTLFTVTVKTDFLSDFRYPLRVQVEIAPPRGFADTATGYLLTTGDSAEFAWPADYFFLDDPVAGTYGIRVTIYPNLTIAAGTFTIR